MTFIETTQGQKLFRQYLSKFDGKSTQKVYRSELRQFFNFFHDDISELNKSVFLKYRDHLAQNVGTKTIKRKFSILNQFFKFLEKNLKGFRSPVGKSYGDMKSFQSRDYAGSEEFEDKLKKWQKSLVCESTRKTYTGQVRLFFRWTGKETKDLRQEDFIRYRDHLQKEKNVKIGDYLL